MASSQTSNYGLSQWEATDQVQRTEFNVDNAKIDAALAQKGNCQLFTGSYVGTGTKEQSFTFPAKPYFAAIMGGSFFIIMAHGITSTVSLSSFRQTSLNITWTGNTAAWEVHNYDQDACNTKNVTYQVIALIGSEE